MFFHTFSMSRLISKNDFRDNCGFGLIADISGRKSHKIITKSINALKSMTHRGAIGSDVANVRSGSAQMGSEAVATFGLVMVILGGIRFRPDAVPWLVGLYITAAYWFTSSTSFANPAVTLARSFTDSFSGIRPVDAPGFIISQLVAAVIATYVLGWLFSNKVERSS